MLIEAVLAWSSKRGEEGEKVIGTGFCDAKFEIIDSGENAGRKLSYLFYEESNVAWIDGCEFGVSNFDVVYTDTITIVDK